MYGWVKRNWVGLLLLVVLLAHNHHRISSLTAVCIMGLAVAWDLENRIRRVEQQHRAEAMQFQQALNEIRLSK